MEHTSSSYASVRNNAVRNSGTMPGMGSSNNQQHDGIFLDAGPASLIELNTVDSSGYCGINVSTLNDINTFGSYNNNYYVRPTDESGIITTNAIINGQYQTGFYDLAGWSTAYGYDQQSSKSPIKISAYTINRLIGANKYPNGSFNSNVGVWYACLLPVAEQLHTATTVNWMVVPCRSLSMLLQVLPTT